MISHNVLAFITKNNKEEFEPYYLYDSSEIKQNCRTFQNISYKNKSIHFATMANINSDFLKIIKEENTNVFVNSMGHLKQVMDVGYKGHEIIFTSSAMTEKMMKTIKTNGIKTYLDSPMQLRRWSKLNPNIPVGIRCNIGDSIKPYSNHAGSFIGKTSRLGFSIEEIKQISDKSKITSIHVYVGTDITDITYFMNCYSALIKIAKYFPNLNSLNFGGGFGVSENGEKTFDIDEYNSQLNKLLEVASKNLGRDLSIILEPGRIIGANSGYFICNVSDIKKKDNSILVGVNASIAQFPRPLMYPDLALDPVKVVRDGKVLSGKEQHVSIIYGNSTYSRDIFRKDIYLPEIETGDILVFGNAGAYSSSSYSEFLGFDKPEEYFI
jgi:diaminopimelate decarboxylase